MLNIRVSLFDYYIRMVYLRKAVVGLMTHIQRYWALNFTDCVHRSVPAKTRLHKCEWLRCSSCTAFCLILELSCLFVLNAWFLYFTAFAAISEWHIESAIGLWIVLIVVTEQHSRGIGHASKNEFHVLGIMLAILNASTFSLYFFSSSNELFGESFGELA